MKLSNMNSVQLSTLLHSLCKNDFDHSIVDTIMIGYMQLCGFYPDHAVTALLHFQKTATLILNVNELNKIMEEL